MLAMLLFTTPFTLLLILLLSAQVSSSFTFSSPDSSSLFKHEFSVQGSWFTQFPITKQLPDIGKANCECDFPSRAYTRYPERGLRLMLLYNYRFSKYVYARTGVGVVRSKYRSDADTANLNLVNPKASVAGFDPTIVEYSNKHTHLHIPLSVGTQYKDFEFLLSMHTLFMEANKSVRTDYNGVSKSYLRTSFDDPVMDILTELKLYWSAEFHYRIRNPLKEFFAYTGIVWYKYANDWEVNFGVRVPILNRRDISPTLPE